MLFHVIFGIILCTVVSTMCSECNYRRDYNFSLHSPEEDTFKITKLNWANVTSEVVSEYDGHTEVEVILKWKPTIPLLPSNSSLSRFVTLQRLHMSDLRIEKIAPGAFSGLKNLNVLLLARNNIATVPFGVFNELQCLQELDLSDNQISVLEENCFSGLTNLDTLLLSFNKLTVTNDKTFQGLASLTKLDISGNMLTEIQNYDLPALRNFWVGINDLKEFNIDLSQTHLIEIYLNYCNLSEVDFALFSKNLRILNLQRNKIKSLVNFEKLKAKRLYLDQNELSGIEIYPQHVSHLYIRYNKIKTLKNSLLGENSELKALYLNHNEIVEIDSESFLGLSNLKILELAHNQLKSLKREVFKNLKNLKRLRLEFNGFKQVDPNALADLHNLNYLVIPNAAYSYLNSSSIPSEAQVIKKRE